MALNRVVVGIQEQAHDVQKLSKLNVDRGTSSSKMSELRKRSVNNLNAQLRSLLDKPTKAADEGDQKENLRHIKSGKIASLGSYPRPILSEKQTRILSSLVCVMCLLCVVAVRHASSNLY